MKINPVGEFCEQTLISHLILHCMEVSLNSMELEEVANKNRDNDGIEVKLLIEGKEVDTKSFCDHWES